MISDTPLKESMMRTEPEASEESTPFAERLGEHRRRLGGQIRSIFGGSDSVLFDGEMMSSDEAEERYRSLKRRQQIVILELLVLFVVMGGLAYFAWKTIIGLSG